MVALVVAMGTAGCGGGKEVATGSSATTATTPGSLGSSSTSATATTATTAKTATTTRGRATTTAKPPPATGGTTVPEITPTTSQQVTTTQATAPPRQPRRIAYPSGGAQGQVFPSPPDTFAYELLTSRQCAALLDKTATVGLSWQPDQLYLYRAAANACLGNWTAASADFDLLAPFAAQINDNALNTPISGDCPSDVANTSGCPNCEKAVLDWLTQVVNAYRSDPTLPPLLTGTAAPLC